MQCPICKEGKIDLLRIVESGNRILRLKKCLNCKVGFVSEEFLINTNCEMGADLKKELYAEIYRQEKFKGLIPKGNPKNSQPKQRRQVAPKPNKRVEGEVYLTYGEIFEKFKERSEVADQITDYRPYPLIDHSIIIWYQDGTELATEYRPDIDCFFVIPNAKTYEEILAEKGRK